MMTFGLCGSLLKEVIFGWRYKLKGSERGELSGVSSDINRFGP